MKPKQSEPTRRPQSGEAGGEGTATSGDMSAYAGDYLCDELGAIYRLAIVNGKLSLAAILDEGGFPRDTMPSGLDQLREDQFVIRSRGVRLRFTKDAHARPVSFVANAGRTRGLVFTRVAGK